MSGGLGSRTTAQEALMDKDPTYSDPYTRIAWWQEKCGEERIARVRAEEALRDARRYCESYCEATDPDPRDDDGEEMSVASAYVLSAMLAIDEGLAAVAEENK